MSNNDQQTNQKYLEKILQKMYDDTKSSEKGTQKSVEENSEDLEQLLSLALKKYQDEQDLEDKQKDISHIKYLLSEYLNDFMIIGHNLKGERVVIRVAKTPKDYDALIRLFERVFSDFMI
jgi:putative IMPACT (imprinted ancient) family translation regulator